MTEKEEPTAEVLLERYRKNKERAQAYAQRPDVIEKRKKYYARPDVQKNAIQYRKERQAKINRALAMLEAKEGKPAKKK